MILKLIITNQSDASFTKELDFSRFPVSLGREDNNDVSLPDPLKIVSRKHAKIIDTEGILQLIDLGSANFTYLNEQRIEPNEENPLKSGDKIKIGEYELDVQLIVTKEQRKAVPTDDQKTMVFSSPYREEISLIAENLKIIAEKYSFDNSNMKSEALKFSILQGLGRIEKNDVNKIITEFFVENFLDKDFHLLDKREKNISSRNLVEEFPKKEMPSIVKQPISEDSRHLSRDYSLTSHFTDTIDVLLDTFAKLIHGFLQFRQEFFGVTVYHTMPTSSLKELKEYLFNPAISSDEEKKRLNLLKEETQKLLSHQIGLLEGYMNSITEGSKSLLQNINPEIIEAEIENKSKNTPGLDIGKILPSTRKAKILEVIKENYKKYISDPYHIEKKFFRPSFMKGYQKRISSKPQNDF
jgi:pSer/pThr/pTyr-binding forkhead associated (FHA) protein